MVAALAGDIVLAARRLTDAAQSIALAGQREEACRLQVEFARSEPSGTAVTRFAAAARINIHCE